jgi:hypothetical protein
MFNTFRKIILLFIHVYRYARNLPGHDQMVMQIREQVTAKYTIFTALIGLPPDKYSHLLVTKQ